MGRKWAPVGKIHFPSLFILWSKVEKRMEKIENDVLKNLCHFWCSQIVKDSGCDQKNCATHFP